jgi:16S rRNA (guanine(966)-N(2))-methyltransferase RsmD
MHGAVKKCLTQKGFSCSIDQERVFMRITGGTGRGRRLQVPAGSRVRPTSDKVKQALFNILGERVVDAAFLDLFAGAGGIGLEALSRGAAQVTFVESSPDSLAAIRKNLELPGFAGRARIVPAKVKSFLKKAPEHYDVVFLDPPYAEEPRPLLELLAASGMVRPQGLVIAEHFRKQPSPENAGALRLFREARYGDTVLAFYELQESGPENEEAS